MTLVAKGLKGFNCLNFGSDTESNIKDLLFSKFTTSSRSQI